LRIFKLLLSQTPSLLLKHTHLLGYMLHVVKQVLLALSFVHFITFLSCLCL